MCGFELGRRNVADRSEQSSSVEPIDPLEHGEFDRFEALPRTAAEDDLGFEERIDDLGKRVVKRVAGASDGRLNAGFGVGPRCSGSTGTAYRGR
jgi:hypothetical protein